MEAGVIGNYRRLVVKVGSSLLIGSDESIDAGWLDSLATDLAGLAAGGCQLLVVSSGAIAIGAATLGIQREKARLEELQAAAAAGQTRLVQAWQDALARHDLRAAQILLTPVDTENRRRFLNARGTLATLLGHGVVPIINENDTVTTEEIRYGDNDRLAARVAQLVMADGLVLLSDVDGLYDGDPRLAENAQHIAVVDAIDDALVGRAGETRTGTGSGGMRTKVLAARIATRAGCETLIVHGGVRRPLTALTGGARHTRFRAAGTPAAIRKQWLAGILEPAGRLVVDPGAERALVSGGSLLPVGVSAVEGAFQRGDVVAVHGEDGADIGRGVCAYGAVDAQRIAGRQSGEIEGQLGYRGSTVMIHRDDLVVFADGR